MSGGILMDGTVPSAGLLTVHAQGPMPIGRNTPGLLAALLQRVAAANMRAPQPAQPDPEAERAMAEMLGLIPREPR